ncbi:MAG: hypothetical protein ACFCU6_16000 [Balneolaceae bacterium]
MNKNAITYYSLASLFALLTVASIIHLLNWPALAEIPLGISLFLQIMAGSKYIYVNAIERRDFSLLKITSYFNIYSSAERAEVKS